MREITVTENDAGQRLDKFLAKFMPALPKGMLYKGLRKNFVRINGKHAKDGSVFLKNGDVLTLYWSDEFFTKKSTFIPIKNALDTVYEDENILLINKKRGTVVHADDKGTENTLIDEIKSYLFEKGEYNPETEHSFSPSLCNRLDRNTSGIIIAAKNAESLRILNEKIRRREIRKLYECVVEGELHGTKTLNAYITRHEKRVSVSDTPSADAKTASLTYTVLAADKKHSLCSVELHTGRTHQIRAMLAHIGHPLEGDVKYGGSKVCGYSGLISRRLVFDFRSDAGILNYLTGKEFSVSSDFTKMFSLIN